MTLAGPPARTEAGVDEDSALDRAAGLVLRYGLVAILVYIGSFKFHPAEAEGIRPMVANSPLFAWLHGLLGVQGASNLIGVVELAIAALIALRPLSPRAALVGSVGAVGMFLSTLSFLVTTPGVWVSVPGFPLPVPTADGGFLLKDWFLLGAALWSAAECRRALRGVRS